MADGEEAKQLSDLIEPLDFPHVHADHPLYVALERMGAAKLDVLPVVSRANVHHLMGVVTLQDVLNSYGVLGAGSSQSPQE
jgi:CBS domain-containing protein